MLIKPLRTGVIELGAISLGGNVSVSPDVYGFGAPHLNLSRKELKGIIEEALSTLTPDSRALAIIPDKTRDDNTDILFPIAAEFMSSRGIRRFEALIAQGTHAAMNDEEKLAKIGAASLSSIPGLACIHDHRWDDPSSLIKIGELTGEEVSKITGGLMKEALPLTVNHLLDGERFDTVLVFGATVPHEVAGFAGGAKYFFPGVAGPELTNATHWLGALATIANVIGRVETPTRHLIEAAAGRIPVRVISINSVVTREDDSTLKTCALFAGDIRFAFRKAAEISRQVHIKHIGRRYKRIIALLDERYDELWVGGKASYKLGGIIKEGGELIIYAPKMNCVSRTHGHMIERFGYAPLEVVKKWVEQYPELRDSLGVAAHLTHVTYGSRVDETGRIEPKYRIILASSIDEETCRRVNLGYIDYRNMRLKDFEGDPDTLVVERAGRDLYLVE